MGSPSKDGWLARIPALAITRSVCAASSLSGPFLAVGGDGTVHQTAVYRYNRLVSGYLVNADEGAQLSMSTSVPAAILRKALTSAWTSRKMLSLPLSQMRYAGSARVAPPPAGMA